jgi:hypothetical protein
LGKNWSKLSRKRNAELSTKLSHLTMRDVFIGLSSLDTLVKEMGEALYIQEDFVARGVEPWHFFRVVRWERGAHNGTCT